MSKLWPMVVIILIALYAAAVVEASGAAWAYYLLLASPLAAVGFDRWCIRPKLSHVEGVNQRGNRISVEPRGSRTAHKPMLNGNRPEQSERRAGRIVRRAELETARPEMAARTARNGAGFGRQTGLAVATANDARHRTSDVAPMSRGGRGRIVRRSPFDLN
ncbi:MAG: hypothetical protein SH859_09780 [Hyphomicrobium aestuarii]|nr:hypothetical protein [Hyphomicrobium aestuarii]